MLRTTGNHLHKKFADALVMFHHSRLENLAEKLTCMYTDTELLDIHIDRDTTGLNAGQKIHAVKLFIARNHINTWVIDNENVQVKIDSIVDPQFLSIHTPKITDYE